MKSLLLLISAFLLLAILAPFALVASVVMLFVKDSRERNSGFSMLFYSLAVAVDVFGNVMCADLFNICLIYHGGYRFGRVGETVSSVLGKNQMTGTLSKSGLAIVRVLDKVEKDHCIKWVDNRFNDTQIGTL